MVIDINISKKELADLTDFVVRTSAGVISRTALFSGDDNNDSICSDGTCSVS